MNSAGARQPDRCVYGQAAYQFYGSQRAVSFAQSMPVTRVLVLHIVMFPALRPHPGRQKLQVLVLHDMSLSSSLSHNRATRPDFPSDC